MTNKICKCGHTHRVGSYFQKGVCPEISCTCKKFEAQEFAGTMETAQDGTPLFETKEFNLSERIFGYTIIPKYTDCVRVSDIKEFIKRLKEVCDNNVHLFYGTNEKEMFVDYLNKLAGLELSK